MEHRAANGRKSAVLVREFEAADEAEVQRIFYEGMMEMIPDTAFRGLRHHPESLLLYASITAVSVAVSGCWWLIGLLPALLLAARYCYSHRVIHGYLRRALTRDMGDIHTSYMKPPGSCLWVALLGDQVVGLVAAVGQSDQSGQPSGAVELQRMSVDRRYRRCGTGSALGRKVLEFAVDRGYSTVVLGTTAYTQAPHQLYLRLGFRCVAVTDGYLTPGARASLLERIFYRVRHHHYSLTVGTLH